MREIDKMKKTTNSAQTRAGDEEHTEPEEPTSVPTGDRSSTALNSPRSQKIGLILTLLSAFTFASKTILVKMSYRYGVDPITVLALRMAFAGSIFGVILAYNVFRGHWDLHLPPRQWVWVILLGVFGYYLSALMDFSGLAYIDASLGRMILFLYPTMVVLLNALLLRQPIKHSVWVALSICYGGILLMMAPNMGGEQKNIWLGSGLVFGSAMLYALYLVAVDRLLKDISAAKFTSLVMCVSCLAVLIHFLVVKDLKSLEVPMPVIINGLVMGSISTVLPIYTLTAGIARIGASKAAMVSMFGPVLTMIMGVGLLGETLLPIQIVGMILVIAGVVRVGK